MTIMGMLFWDLVDIAITDADRYLATLHRMSEQELFDHYWKHREMERQLIDDYGLLQHMDTASEDGVRMLAEWIVGQGGNFYESAVLDMSIVPKSAPNTGLNVIAWIYGTYKERFGDPGPLLDGLEGRERRKS